MILINPFFIFFAKCRDSLRGPHLQVPFLVIIAIAICFAAPIYSQNVTILETGKCAPNIPERLRTSAFISKASQVSGILEELATRRENFLANGDLTDLFPTLYFHSTKAEFDRVIRSGSFMEETTLDLIIVFYNAYKFNHMRFREGGSGAVEKHWKRYYKGAVAANRSGKASHATITSILLDGVDAHIDYDLPRSIRSIISSNRTPLEKLKSEYDKMDKLFADVAKESNRDIISARKVSGWFASLDKAFGLGAIYVINSRQLAWELAVGGQRLPTKREQPFFFQDSQSISYFTVNDDDPRCKNVFSR